MSGPGAGADRLELARSVAVEAGRFIVSRRAAGFAVSTKSSAHDLVTEVDREAERLIFDRLRAAAPGDALLGEEESFGGRQPLAVRLHEAAAAPYLWIVDPLDGTTNFVHDLGGYTVSIALARHGEVMLGAVYDPLREELFWAERGRGAFVNGRPLRVAEAAGLGQSLLGTSLPTCEEDREQALQELAVLGAQCHKLRALGSAALQLAYVAAGRLTAYWHRGLRVWDWAAGALLVAEAGGAVCDLRAGGGCVLATRDVLASNGAVQDELLAHLRH